MVRSALISEAWGRQILFLTLSVDGSAITARILDFPQRNLSDLVDSTVRVRGVCGTIFNDKRQLLGVRMFTPTLGDVVVEEGPRVNPFAIPALSLNQLF